MSNQTTCVTSPIANGRTTSNSGVPLGLINYMVYNRIATNARNIAQACCIGRKMVRPYWLNLQVGNNVTHICDVVGIIS